MQYSYAMPAHLPPSFYGYFQTPMQLLRATSSNIGSQNPNPPSSSVGAQNGRGHGHLQWWNPILCQKILFYKPMPID